MDVDYIQLTSYKNDPSFQFKIKIRWKVGKFLSVKWGSVQVRDWKLKAEHSTFGHQLELPSCHAIAKHLKSSFEASEGRTRQNHKFTILLTSLFNSDKSMCSSALKRKANV